MNTNPYLPSVAPTNHSSGATINAAALPSEKIWVEGPRTNFLITAAHTNGQAALIEAVLTRTDEPELHSHANMDETYYVVVGKMTFTVDDHVVSAPTGTTVFIGRGRQHTFTVDTKTASVIVLLTMSA